MNDLNTAREIARRFFEKNHELIEKGELVEYRKNGLIEYRDRTNELVFIYNPSVLKLKEIR